MARQDPALTSFNGGELSPWLRGRFDVAKYAQGAERLFNMIARVQGPAVRRPGTIYIGQSDSSGGMHAIGFEANTGSNTLIEVAPGYMRFWDGGTRQSIRNNGGAWAPGPISLGAYAQLVTPWGTLYNAVDATPLLQHAQSNDVMWIVHPSTMPQKLSRIAAYQFALANMGDGVNVPVPFKDVNPNTNITITASATAGVVTLTASAPYFTAAMVGEYFYLEQPLNDSILPWETNKAIAVNDRRKSDGKNYIAGTAGTTGTVKPTHTVGSKNDGGVVWTFFDDGYGVVGINGFNSPTSVTTVAAIQLPDSVRAVGTTRYARQAWNIDEGYPNAVALFRERLCFARGQTVWCSVAGDYENFQRFQAGGQTAIDLAIVLTIAAEKNDRILWLASLTRLIAGCSSGIWSIGEASIQDPFGPGNAQAHKVSSDGANGCRPVKMNEGLLYVQKGGVRLRELLYNMQIDDFGSVDLSEYAEHIPATVRITQLAVTRLPDPIVWCIGAVRLAGTQQLQPFFAGMTYSRAQQVSAWHMHRLGDTNSSFLAGAYGQTSIYSIAAILSPDLVNDDVWMMTVRTFRDNTQGKFLELMGPAAADGYAMVPYTQMQYPAQAAYLDFSGPSKLLAAGDHIPAPWMKLNEIAMAQVAGAVSPPAAIDASGLPSNAAHPYNDLTAWVGYNYNSDLKPMGLVGGSAVGQAAGKLGKVSGFVVRVYLSGPYLYGYSDDLVPSSIGPGFVLDVYREEMRTQSDQMDSATGLKSGDFLARPEHGHESPPRVFIRMDLPLPLNVLGIYPRLEVEDEA